LRTKQIIVDRAEQILRALRVFETGKADFADCLIERTGSSEGYEQILTFDVNAAKYAGSSSHKQPLWWTPKSKMPTEISGHFIY